MIKVPANVLSGLESARENGSYNMFDHRNVANWCLVHGYDETYHWIMENKSDYLDGIIAGFGAIDLTE